jgi:hypothetical protein
VLLPENRECGCEVYKSFRPQEGMKDGACMAANGDDASIIVNCDRSEATFPWLTVDSQLTLSSKLFYCREIAFEEINFVF